MPGGSRPLAGSSRISTSRVAQQRGGDREPLAHAHRVALDAPVGGGARARPARAPRPRAARDGSPAAASTRRWLRPLRPGWKLAVLEHGADLRARVRELLVGDAAEGRGAGVRADQAEQHAQRGRLAGAVRAEEAGHAAGLDLEGEVVDGDRRSRSAWSCGDATWSHRMPGSGPDGAAAHRARVGASRLRLSGRRARAHEPDLVGEDDGLHAVAQRRACAGRGRRAS